MVSIVPVAGGVAAKDVALVGGQALILQEGYGFSVADGGTLAPLGRFDANLPRDPQARDFEEMAIEGTSAYLATWGYGLMIVDISSPLKATELGRLPFPYASAIDEAGGYAYIGKQTNGGEFIVVGRFRSRASREARQNGHECRFTDQGERKHSLRGR
ncbi:MAG: hypothetical protein WDN04_18165 [Rhodospirillales bacterium]